MLSRMTKTVATMPADYASSHTHTRNFNVQTTYHCFLTTSTARLKLVEKFEMQSSAKVSNIVEVV